MFVLPTQDAILPYVNCNFVYPRQNASCLRQTTTFVFVFIFVVIRCFPTRNFLHLTRPLLFTQNIPRFTSLTTKSTIFFNICMYWYTVYSLSVSQPATSQSVKRFGRISHVHTQKYMINLLFSESVDGKKKLSESQQPFSIVTSQNSIIISASFMTK